MDNRITLTLSEDDMFIIADALNGKFQELQKMFLKGEIEHVKEMDDILLIHNRFANILYPRMMKR